MNKYYYVVSRCAPAQKCKDLEEAYKICFDIPKSVLKYDGAFAIVSVDKTTGEQVTVATFEGDEE